MQLHPASGTYLSNESRGDGEHTVGDGKRKRRQAPRRRPEQHICALPRVIFGIVAGTFEDELVTRRLLHPTGDRTARVRTNQRIGDDAVTDLSTSMADQASLFAHYGIESAKAAHQVDQVKLLVENTEAAVAAYRQAFDPTGVLDQPYVMLGVNVLCAPTLDEARYLAGPGRLAMARLRSGRPDVYPTPEEAAAHTYTPQEDGAARSWGRHHVIGPPEAVRAGLLDLAERTGADELMITTMTHGLDDRLRSYRLVADAMGLEPRSAAA